MPQLIPYTFELQYNTAVALIGLAVVALACYILPSWVKLLVARTHQSV